LPDTGFITRLLALEKAVDSPYINTGIAEISTDYLKGEAAVRPVEGDTITIYAKKYTWHVRDKADGMWASAARDYFASYGCLYVYSPEARPMHVAYMRDENFSFFLNGQKRFTATGPDFGVIHSDTMTMPAGVNCLLFKITERLGTNYYAIKFTDDKGKNIRGLRYLFSPDTNAALAVPRPTTGIGSGHPRLTAWMSRSGLRMYIRAIRGSWRLELISSRGEVVISRHGESERTIVVGRKDLPSGIYAAVLHAAAGRLAMRILVP